MNSEGVSVVLPVATSMQISATIQISSNGTEVSNSFCCRSATPNLTFACKLEPIIFSRRSGSIAPVTTDRHWRNHCHFSPRPSLLHAYQKSVVEGKSVAVRVDFGGCSIIQ